MMDKRIVLAIILSIIVMIGWNYWYFQRYKDVIEKNRLEQVDKRNGEKGADAVKPVEPATPQPQEENLPEPAPLMPFGQEEETAQTDSDESIVVDTGVMTVTMSRKGAVITSLALNKYKDEDGEPVNIVNEKSELRPLSVEFATEEASARINSALFKTSAPPLVTLSEGRPDATVTFTYSLDTGFRLVKSITFHHDSYNFDVVMSINHPGASVTGGSSYSVTWPGMGEGVKSFYSYHGPVVLVDGKRLTEKPDEGEKQTYEGEVEWAGLVSKYYCVAFVPEEKKTKVVNRFLGDEKYSSSIQLVSRGGVSQNRFTVYAGPKIRSELAKVNKQLKKMINYGWFDFIAKPLFAILVWLYSILGNLGWAIILLTVIIKILFFPLTQKSFKSMRNMQKLQPKMKLLQERYKNDKTKMNEELIALYKQHKVNPLGGCLPMVLQIPVFIALYKVLLESIELKGAPFIFWITDMSVKDPYYITPVLMGLSMFAQQKLSPSSADPMQKNMMLLLPVVFTVMFLNFPSGLVIYWLVNNLLSILQQYYVNRTHKYEVA